MRMQKKEFRIGELAKKLNVERFVIRFWEKEFDIKPHRSEGGQRFYIEDDLNTFQLIKDLLYNNGFTIQGARQQLKKSPDESAILGSHRTEIEHNTASETSSTSPLCERAQLLKEKLIELRERLYSDPHCQDQK
jgi:DNA-binding transcriptional MerR regulator